MLERKATLPRRGDPEGLRAQLPQGQLGAQLLGHLGEIDREQLKQRRYSSYAAGDVIGQGGVEGIYDRWLRGSDGVAKIEVDAMGRPEVAHPGRVAAACRCPATRWS